MKIDMHVHSKYSYDGASEVEDIFKWAEKRDLDGVAITDHFDNRAWERAQEEAEKRNMFFIPGEELRILDQDKNTVAEVLVYFLEKPMGNNTIEEIYKEVESQDGLLFLAHPFAKTRPSPDDIKNLLSYLDGIETINSRSRLNSINKKSIRFAKEDNLPGIGGSDAHIPREVGYAYTEVEDAEDLDEFKEALKEGEAKARGKITNPLLHFVSQVKGRL